MDFKKMSFLMLMMLFLFVVWGCADSSTKGDSKEISPKVTMYFTDITGNVNINPFLDTDSSKGDTDQDTENSASFDPAATVPVGLNGGASSAATEGASMVADVASQYFKDKSKRNTDNQNTEQEVTPAAVEPIDEEEEVDPEEPTSEWSKVGLKDERVAGKWFAWIDRNGTKFTSPLIVKFPECDNAIMTIDDPSNAWGADGNSSNHNQMFYFSGSPDKQEDTHMGCEGGCASIFSPPDCEKATYALFNQEAKYK